MPPILTFVDQVPHEDDRVEAVLAEHPGEALAEVAVGVQPGDGAEQPGGLVLKALQ